MFDTDTPTKHPSVDYTCELYNMKVIVYTVQKLKFPVKDFLSKREQIRIRIFFSFIEEIFNGKLHFF